MTPSTQPSPKRKPVLLCALALIALCSGCISRPSRVDELLKHPEFPIAAQMAPHFTSEALKALADAEARAK